MLDVRRLRVLREVAAHGSFSAAAEALSYTQSAVSQQIAALEREAGSRLVERSARGVRLTDAGRALVGHTDAILARLADAEDELQAIAGLRGGRLRLAAFPSACSTLMPLAVALFRERHPGVDLSLHPAEPDVGLRLLRAGEADIALSIEATFSSRTDVDVDAITLLDDPMYIMLHRDHPMAGRARLRLVDLADDSWMIGTAGNCPDASIFLRACQAAGFEPRIAFNLDDYNAIQGFVAAGMGVSFIPDLALIAVREDVVVRSLGARPPVRRIIATTLADSFRSPAKQAMLDVLTEVSAAFGTRRTELALAS
ncbi:MAG TPA: LysR substrate-binding domain-containing protein [Baekduia sp.]|uniref:LysR family transcriptional regulator n=1 Tax=Baekduia sp. TaxID=2600305 RepID=UPI002CC6871D|nr:LysR substrate-binding domain-containing protein [Baekduia sp.]HMJ33399.1 LysR substrate-binding domain-containing protein [Baekduia sp.]